MRQLEPGRIEAARAGEPLEEGRVGGMAREGGHREGAHGVAALGAAGERPSLRKGRQHVGVAVQRLEREGTEPEDRADHVGGCRVPREGHRLAEPDHFLVALLAVELRDGPGRGGETRQLRRQRNPPVRRIDVCLQAQEARARAERGIEARDVDRRRAFDLPLAPGQHRALVRHARGGLGRQGREQLRSEQRESAAALGRLGTAPAERRDPQHLARPALLLFHPGENVGPAGVPYRRAEEVCAEHVRPERSRRAASRFLGADQSAQGLRPVDLLEVAAGGQAQQIVEECPILSGRVLQQLAVQGAEVARPERVDERGQHEDQRDHSRPPSVSSGRNPAVTTDELRCSIEVRIPRSSCP